MGSDTLNFWNGIFRLWVVCSVIWSAYVVLTWPTADANQFGPYVHNSKDGFFRHIDQTWLTQNRPRLQENSFVQPALRYPWRRTETLLIDPASEGPCDKNGQVVGVCAEFLKQFSVRDDSRRSQYLEKTPALVVVPPLAVLAFGFAIRWVVRGFQKAKVS